MNTNYTAEMALLLKNLAIQLGTLLENIKNEHSMVSIVSLLTLSFLYGLVHAAGPGHGKTLVASYFTSNDKNYKKALSLSFMIATVHTFSALILTYVLYYLFQNIFSVAIINIADIATKISGALIISIGVYLMYGKYRHYKSTKTLQWSTQKIASCNCASCKTQNSTDVALVLAAGLIPCPGTITVFLFSISLGLYWIGFLSAVVMSLGMSSIIALTALASVKIRNSSKNRYSKLLKYLDFGATFIIIILGLILILN
jgi:ABC-type nickel/cobalt efflux system permease component RcnA